MTKALTRTTVDLIERVKFQIQHDQPSSGDLDHELARIVQEVEGTGKCQRDYRNMRDRYFTVYPEFGSNWRAALITFCAAFDMAFFESGDGESIVFLRRE